ncbi:NTP transferase domain-containing protein [Fructobacillus sp. M1-13]|uniref:Glucose-1-phosphate thymidylyltransferase n=1 Tax=Fructobacillus papyriferae TaxID=2713171 RepID=A0ABS5QNF3_9LACO|nr:sugar phosphate nucleotidyltransferase [Fructobacillus papyriferae]MBS9334596.1 sugar nucleotidyltransferase [Fructobacillus papyriferae]MCD2158585.1 NTP transferase domain-containing protein [Fructobacillus papyriferae]
MKGVILSSGFGKRLWPVTEVSPKVVHPIYNKPSIYYSLAFLIQQGVTEIGIVGTDESNNLIRGLFNDGCDLGCKIKYLNEAKKYVRGTATSLACAEDFVQKEPFILLLGDSLFIDKEAGCLGKLFNQVMKARSTSFNLLMPVYDARQYAYFDKEKAVEKGNREGITQAISGLYFFQPSVFQYLKKIKQSERGEYELVSVINLMMQDHYFETLGPFDHVIWTDTGVPELLYAATSLIRQIELLTGRLIGSPHYEAYKKGLVNKTMLVNQFQGKNSSYAEGVRRMLPELKWRTT